MGTGGRADGGIDRLRERLNFHLVRARCNLTALAFDSPRGVAYVDSEVFRDGIFALNTRRFGTVGELLVKRLVNLGKGRSLFHDLYDDWKLQRVEVKFSRVQKEAEIKVTESTVLEAIESATLQQRMICYADWENHEFDCNVQQVKRAEFDVLYYGLFFADAVLVFRIASHDIGSEIQYSDLQHKGNVGEGQFHINRRTMATHLERYLYQKLSYDELLQLLQD